MIIDFSVSNYKLITKKQTISLEALTGKRDKQSKDNIVNAKYRIAGYGILGGKTKNIKLLKDVYVFGKEEALQNLKGAIEVFNKIISEDNFYDYDHKLCSKELAKIIDNNLKFEITFLLDNIKYIYRVHYDSLGKVRELFYYPKGKKTSLITNEVFNKALDYLSNIFFNSSSNRLDQIKFSSDTFLMNQLRKDQIYLADFNDNVYVYPITDYYNSRKEDIENDYLCGRFGAIDRNKLIKY